MKLHSIIPAIAAAITLATPVVAEAGGRPGTPAVHRHGTVVHRGAPVVHRSRPVAYRGHYGHRHYRGYGYGYGYRGYYGRPVIGVRPIPIINGIVHAIFGHPGPVVYRGGRVY